MISVARACKRALLRNFPRFGVMLQRAWRRRHLERFQAQLGLPAIVRSYTNRYGLRVQSGPFAGMSYVAGATGSMFLPKLIGSYEAELHSVMSSIRDNAYSLVVDIGCAEGYYAVGFALMLRDCSVIACDIDPHARAWCAALAKENGVSNRITLLAECSPALLEAEIAGRTLVFCDCEGAEYVLLDPERAPKLAEADLLIELHPSSSTDDAALMSRFERSHSATVITSEERSSADYPIVDFLPPDEARLALCEFRPPAQRWLWLGVRKPHAPPESAQSKAGAAVCRSRSEL